MDELLSKTFFSEQRRTKDEPWKIDPADDGRYWRKLAKRLATRSLDAEDEARAELERRRILDKVVYRYANEIVGYFKVPTFRFARRFLTFFFGRLLNAASIGSLRGLFYSKVELRERLRVRGYVEQVRELSKRGTVVFVPTHFSNLDSILIGYAMDQVAGLPAVSFGAGLNLYNTGYTAYFMNRLGAYRVDRRKRNPIYLTALKTFSRLIIQKGVPSLFFPGGTRSRSGKLETRLKLGLLGTAVEAQRKRYQDGRDDKVFIVPVILSYPFVLEAQFLIEQHLRKEGQERYVRTQDNFHSFRQIVKFIFGVFSKGNRITISLGKPLDILGNQVDATGKSFTKSGRHVSLREYFKNQYGEVNADYQRESEYTRLLGESIVKRYHADGIVLSSHLVSYAAFGMVEAAHPDLDLFALMRLPADNFYFDEDSLLNVIGQLRAELLAMDARDAIKLDPEILEEPAAILQHGLNSLGLFHIDRPLHYDKEKRLVSDSFAMLYYYHNRLSTYGLNAGVKWPRRLLRDARYHDFFETLTADDLA